MSRFRILYFFYLNYFAYGFYINKEHINGQDGKIQIENLNLSFADSLFENDFPLKFVIQFTNFEKNENISVEFTKLPKDHRHPIGFSNIYTLDKTTENLINHELKNNSLEKWELYLETNGTSTATLIQNTYFEESNEDSQKFRLIATVYEKNLNGIKYDILPVYESKQSSKRNKRSNKHFYSHAIITRSDNSHKSFLAEYVKQDYEKLGRIKIKNKKRSIKTIEADQPLELYVEVLLVADYTLYKDHMEFSGTNDTNIIFALMRTYFAHYINEVNQRFQNSFSNDPNFHLTIKLSNIIILENEAESNWTNRQYVGSQTIKTYKGRDVVLTLPTLNAFKKFMISKNISFNYDYAIGLFNKDLWATSGSSIQDRASVVGFSYQSGICTESKYSIAEEIGGYLYSSVAAHELAHNLGAYHDQDAEPISANCLASDNYIMTPTIGAFSYNLTNQQKFSNCSIMSIKNSLLTSDFSNISTQAECLLNLPKINNELKQYKSFAGEMWTADDQCKMIYGQNASFCQHLSNQMCSALACRVSESATGCTFINGNGAAAGTSCASGKICMNGQCVINQKAITGDCLFGDDVVVNYQVIAEPLPKNQMTCEEVFYYLKTLNQFPVAYCSESNFSQVCCQTCKKYQPLNCVDKEAKCPDYQIYCSTGALINNVLVEDLCPRTCGSCKKEPIYCKNETSYCLNGGKCLNITDVDNDEYIGYKCNCSTGFSGDQCQIKNICDPNPCQNSGKCVNLGSLGFRCLCTKDFNGIYCDSKTLVSLENGLEFVTQPNLVTQISSASKTKYSLNFILLKLFSISIFIKK